MFFQNDTPYLYKLLSIDPGSFLPGFCIVHLDLKNKTIERIKAWTVNVDALKNDTGLAPEFYTDLFIRSYKLRNEVSRILFRENIHGVAYENPFMNPKRPNAYGPLLTTKTLIMDAMLEYGPGIPFYSYAPQKVKKAVGVAGKRTKEAVARGIENIPILVDALRKANCVLDELDDNGVDAIAVSYTAIINDIFTESPYAA